jgi:hypothetical protein
MATDIGPADDRRPVLTVVAFGIFGHRLWWLRRLAFSGQPAPERRGGGTGAAGLCSGGGQGDALILRVPAAR